jgi:hypothetical protein
MASDSCFTFVADSSESFFIGSEVSLNPADEEGSRVSTVGAAVDYIFGYGSIINNTSRLATINSTLSARDNRHDDNAAIAVLSPRFGYVRSWCYRAGTGFTALGLEPSPPTSVVDESLTPNDQNGICGVLFPVPSSDALAAFDVREVGYFRKSVPSEMITLMPEFGTQSNKEFALKLQDKLYSKRIWVYVPEAARSAAPDEDFPILQTYVDICLRGCLEWGGRLLAERFLTSTTGWSEFYLNDAPMSRRPWLHRPEYSVIDDLLQRFSHVRFMERRHPEEYASRHLTTAQGMWNVPSKNNVFICRESYLQAIQASLLKPAIHSKCNNNVLQLIGIGGVGKTQLASEYCHRHFGSAYGLVVFVRAETPAIIASELRRFAVDMGMLDSSKSFEDDTVEMEQDTPSATDETANDLDDVEVIELVKRKLSKSRYRWLLVFDNMDDISRLPQYLPRGRMLVSAGSGANDYECGGGHVIVTSRVTGAAVNKSGSQSLLGREILCIECFDKNESIKFLEISLSESDRQIQGKSLRDSESDTKQQQADKRDMASLAERMGHLPLALAQAVAYLTRCDVTICEYIGRLNTLMVSGIEGDYSIVSSLSVTLDRILHESEATFKVLILLGFLSPDRITKRLVSELLMVSHFENAQDEKSKTDATSHCDQRVPLIEKPLTVSFMPLTMSYIGCSFVAAVLSRQTQSLAGFLGSVSAATAVCIVAAAAIFSATDPNVVVVRSPALVVTNERLLFETDQVWYEEYCLFCLYHAHVCSFCQGIAEAVFNSSGPRQPTREGWFHSSTPSASIAFQVLNVH